MLNKRQLKLNMHHSLSALLFPGYRRSVLALLLLHPEEALHGREIARRTGLAAGTLTRELARLAEAGLLHREQRGNQQVYSANTGCPIFAELASILRKTSGIAEVLAQALAPLAPKLRLAFVFGSVAQGKETAGSDIDVLLVGDASFRQTVALLHPTQAQLGREVNPKLYTPAEFLAQLSQAGQGQFLADVLAKPKIYLIGNDSELEKLSRHQP
jgi:DNA-binding transcriptional ArsR family regulator